VRQEPVTGPSLSLSVTTGPTSALRDQKIDRIRTTALGGAQRVGGIPNSRVWNMAQDLADRRDRWCPDALEFRSAQIKADLTNRIHRVEPIGTPKRR
jgi:hypothetical protein